MKPFFEILFVAIFGALTVTAAQSYLKNPIVKKMTVEQRTELRGVRRKVIETGCKVNLCFAIDGSGSVTPRGFQRQKDFADLVIDITTADCPSIKDRSVSLTAVQYGTSLKVISPLTSNKSRIFKKLDRAKQVGGLSNIRGALGYCGFQLRKRKRDENKLILLVDGFDPIGILPIVIPTDTLRALGIEIFAIAAGPSNDDLLNMITGDKENVFRIRDLLDVHEIVAHVISGICGY